MSHMSNNIEEKDFMDDSNPTVTNVAEFIRQDCAAKGPNVTIEQYEETRGDFGREVEVVKVTTDVNGETQGFEVAVADEDDPQNIYLVEAEHRLKTLRQSILDSETNLA